MPNQLRHPGAPSQCFSELTWETGSVGLNGFSLKKAYRDSGDVEAGQKEEPINLTKNALSIDFVPGSWDLCCALEVQI